MRKILGTFFLFLLPFSILFAEEDIYSYKFNLDTTITGAIVAEGKIFPNYEVTFVSIFNSLKNEMKVPYIEFLDENFHPINKISFNLKQNIKITPLVYDLDGDSFDEIVFAISEPDKFWYLYYDPSNSPQINRKIFELPVSNHKGNSVITRITPVQLDDDKFFELILSFSGRPFNFLLNGMIAFDIESKKILWENLSTEITVGNKLIGIVDKDLPFLVYSADASTSKKRRFIYSNSKYFYEDLRGNKIVYDKYLNEVRNGKIDTLSDDFSTDSLAFIRAVDNNNNTLWEEIVGGITVQTQIDTIRVGNKKKIVLSTFSTRLKLNINSSVKIIEPRTGNIENEVMFENRIKSTFIDENKIFIAFVDGEIVALDAKLNILHSSQSDFWYKPFAKLIFNNEPLLFVTEGAGIIQSLIALNNNLKKVTKIITKGVYRYLPNSKLVSAYDFRVRKSKLFSIDPIPWYNRISSTLLRNLIISFLTITLVTSLLWVITLRVSSKKIKRQKKEIEEAHKKLKDTTAKLIRIEKLAVYGTIVSGIAHEINSPLGAIINSAQRIKKNPDTNFEKNINLIEKAGRRTKAIIEKVLINTEKKSDDKSDLVEVLNDWQELSQKQFDNLGIILIIDVKCNKKLAISSTELNQIFSNILFNARDAITDSNSNLKEIYVSSSKTENYCQLIIRDTGPGFSMEKLENPFEAFTTTKEVGKGTGLGLWVVKSILDSIDGSIKIRNYEKGAEIEIKLPFYKEK